VRELGPRLDTGDVVLDLACGDGGLADFLPGLGYCGVDASPEMVEAARRRGRRVVAGKISTSSSPTRPCRRRRSSARIYYARDRRALLVRIAGYTEKKLVFDLNPRQYRLADVRADLSAAGFDRLELKPFFIPQTVAPKAALTRFLRVAERSRPGRAAPAPGALYVHVLCVPRGTLTEEAEAARPGRLAPQPATTASAPLSGDSLRDEDGFSSNRSKPAAERSARTSGQVVRLARVEVEDELLSV